MPRHDPPSGVPDPTGRTESLDGIRGIAALVVMLSHCKHALRNAK